MVPFVTLRRGLGELHKSTTTIRSHCRYQHEGNQKPKLSYSSMGSDEPLLGQSVSETLDLTASKYGDREAVVCCHQNIRKTYEDLTKDVDNVACGLLSLGLEKGERIGIWSPNNYEWIISHFAAAKAGLTGVYINAGYKASEMEFCLNKVGVKALVSADVFKTHDYYQILSTLLPSIADLKNGEISDERIPLLRHIIMISDHRKKGTLNFSDFLTSGTPKQLEQLRDLQPKIQFDDPFNIQFTSGTTGKPKGTTLTHHNVVNNAYFFGKRMGLKKDIPPRICIQSPLYHCMGNVMGLMAATIFGGCTLLPSPTFNARAVAEAIHKERATVVNGTPTMFIDILNQPDFEKYSFNSLQRGVMAGAPCLEEIARRTMLKMNLEKLTIGYGLTETSPVILQSFPEDPITQRIQTAGCTADHTEIMIADDNGHVVPRGERGEIWSRGYAVMKGYWEDEEKTRETITDTRWLKTGDLGQMDDDGYVRIIGRIKDMVIRGGENIFPREIEELLHTHEKIIETQVVGVPDVRLGEELCAWIKVKNGQKLSKDEVRKFCEGKLSHFKIPRYVLFTEEFPKTASGKIQKYVLREEAQKKLNLK